MGSPRAIPAIAATDGAREGEDDVPQEDEEWLGYIFPTACPDNGDWSQYHVAYTMYVEPLPWVLALPSEVYRQAGAKDPPEDEVFNYEPWRRRS